MASKNLTGRNQAVVGRTDAIHTTRKNPILSEAVETDTGNVNVYLIGCASTIAGSVVTFDETGQTALIAANAIGPVAVAQAAVLATQYGWYVIKGSCLVDMVANSADNASLGRETTDGKVGDGRAAGDQIIGMIARGATTAAALQTAQLWYPSVNDITGS